MGAEDNSSKAMMILNEYNQLKMHIARRDREIVHLNIRLQEKDKVISHKN
jgi:hypothetical protein